MDGNDASGLQPESELALRAVAMPVFANAHGDIFGGSLLSQMDLAGGTVATRLAKGHVAGRYELWCGGRRHGRHSGQAGRREYASKFD
jgi:hypothetical protein